MIRKTKGISILQLVPLLSAKLLQLKSTSDVLVPTGPHLSRSCLSVFPTSGIWFLQSAACLPSITLPLGPWPLTPAHHQALWTLCDAFYYHHAIACLKEAVLPTCLQVSTLTRTTYTRISASWILSHRSFKTWMAFLQYVQMQSELTCHLQARPTCLLAPPPPPP